MTINVNSVFHVSIDDTGMSVYGILVPSLPSPPFPFFFSCYQLITLLSCCWVCLYFSSFLFAAIILLLEVQSYFISWINQVSMILSY